MSEVKQPNIIYMVSDQHRADWMGCAGNDYVDTPHMDSIAKRGVRFANAHCNYPLCGPSRMSMMTGQHPHRLGVYINEHCLSSDVPTFAHALGVAGYHTMLAGRMHFSGIDQRHGFDDRLVGDICRCYAGGQGTDYGDLAGTASSLKRAVECAAPGDSPVLQYDETVTSAAEQYISDWGGDKPLFMTVGWYGPHHPYIAPQEYYEKAKAKMQAAGDKPVPHLEDPKHPWYTHHVEKGSDGNASAEQFQEVRYNYAGMISYLDTMVGRVLAAASQLPGETVIVYVSDHGEHAGDHGLLGKGTFYDPSIKVPMLMASLDDDSTLITQKNTIIEHNTSLLDVCPTLAALGQAPELPHQDGDALLDHCQGSAVEAEWSERPILAEQELVFLKPIKDPIRMVRQGDWKLIYYYNMDQPHLFNVVNDPEEQTNLARDPEQISRIDAMMELIMDEWDPEWLLKDSLKKGRDLKYMWDWGSKVGLGPLDTWRAGPNH